MFGKKDSKILFVEFSDPSCPFCHVAAGKNPELNKQAGAQFTMEKDGGTYVPPVPGNEEVGRFQRRHSSGSMQTVMAMVSLVPRLFIVLRRRENSGKL